MGGQHAVPIAPFGCGQLGQQCFKAPARNWEWRQGGEVRSDGRFDLRLGQQRFNRHWGGHRMRSQRLMRRGRREHVRAGVSRVSAAIVTVLCGSRLLDQAPPKQAESGKA